VEREMKRWMHKSRKKESYIKKPREREREIKTKISGESSTILQGRFVTTIGRPDFIKLSATKWGAVISF
jgi:hypothetical protein